MKKTNMKKITKARLSKLVKRRRAHADDGIDLSRMDLSGMDLSGMDLAGANLMGANLFDANLSHADLYCANLSGANLSYANLSYADLTSADLSRADLVETDFSYANLSGAGLRHANMAGAGLRHAIISNMNFTTAKNIPSSIPSIVPEVGPFVGWKKAYDSSGRPCIVKLLIAEDAKRSSGTGRKCRCSKAKVLAIETLDGNATRIKCAHSGFDPYFNYAVGKTVKVDDFDEDRFCECAPGIHFFVNRAEAVDFFM